MYPHKTSSSMLLLENCLNTNFSPKRVLQEKLPTCLMKRMESESKNITQKKQVDISKLSNYVKINGNIFLSFLMK